MKRNDAHYRAYLFAPQDSDLLNLLNEDKYYRKNLWALVFQDNALKLISGHRYDKRCGYFVTREKVIKGIVVTL